MCGAIGFEFSDARAVELKCADRGTKFYCGDFDRSIPESRVELSLFYTRREVLRYGDVWAVCMGVYV